MLELSRNQLLHLLRCDLTLIEKSLDLLQGACLRAEVDFVFNYVEACCFEYTLGFLSLAEFYSLVRHLVRCALEDLDIGDVV